MIQTTREQRRQLERENLRWPVAMHEIPRDEWPGSSLPTESQPIEFWRSRHFVAGVYQEAGGILRVSVNRAVMGPGGRWVDGITWDELQQVKREIGRGDRFAVEVYPADRDLVDVANVRHLWLLPEAPAFAWRRAA